jgi:hypothetical protein
MAKKKKGLIEKLKSLLGLDQKPEYMGAMCYETHMPLWAIMKCDLCGTEKEYDQFLMTEDEEILLIVEKIRELGYDAKVMRACSTCADKLGFKYSDGTQLIDTVMYCIFYFKDKGKKEYHITRSESPDDYRAVLAYLKNEESFVDHNDAIHWVADNKEEIERMTGIVVNIPSK